MKIQNCIVINFVMDGCTHRRTDKPKAIYSFNFSKIWGITRLSAFQVFALLIFTTCLSVTHHIFQFAINFYVYSCYRVCLMDYLIFLLLPF